MTPWLLTAVLVPPTAIALILWPSLRSSNALASVLECAGVSLAGALGLTSISFFLWRVAGDPIRWYPMIEISALLALGVLGAYRLARIGPNPDPMKDHATESPWVLILTVALTLVILFSFTLTVVRRFDAAPHGAWDAWAMWNMRAAFLAAPSSHWVDGFTLELGYAPPDYPLLVPASVARLWTYQGELTTLGPILLASEFGIATTLVVAGSLLRIGGYLAATVGIALLLVPGYAEWITSQCADVAVGLYVLIAIALLSARENVVRLSLGGMALGLAAWSKNEGIVAILVIAFGFLLINSIHSGIKQTLTWARPIAIGLGSVLVIVLMFKTAIAPPSEFAAGMTTSPSDRLFDFERHRVAAAYMFGHLPEWGRWRIIAPLWFALGWVAIGLRRPSLRTVAALGVFTVVLMFAGYHMVYVLTTQPLVWQMQASWGRLISQIWPTLVWTAAAGGVRRNL